MAEELQTKEFDNKDVILTSFVNLANNISLEMGVTLNIGGALITGLLIGYDSYLKGISEMLKGHGPGADAFAEQFEYGTIIQRLDRFYRRSHRSYFPLILLLLLNDSAPVRPLRRSHVK